MIQTNNNGTTRITQSNGGTTITQIQGPGGNSIQQIQMSSSSQQPSGQDRQ